MMKKTTQFKQLLNSGRADFIMEAHDGISARIVEEAGFKLIEAKEFAVEMRREAWEYISSFQQYAAGALRGYPVDDAVRAMKEAVQPALEQHGNTNNKGELYITRKWLAISTEA